MKIALHFSLSPDPELVEIGIRSVALGERRSCRGKGLTLPSSVGSFQWTAAVRAFALLVVGTKNGVMSGADTPYSLCCRGKGDASSLDFALSKPTAWVVDLFGMKSSRSSAVRHVFRVTNSGQKLPGPVAIELGALLQERQAISIFVDGSELTDRLAIEDFFLKLGGKTETRLPKERSRSSKAMPWYDGSVFHELLLEEVQSSLAEVELLEPRGLTATLERLKKQRWFRTNRQIKRSLTELKTAQPSAHQRYAPVVRLTKTPRRLRVACLPMAVGAVTLLRSVRELSFELALNYAGTSDILQALDDEKFDFVVVSWGALSKLKFKQKTSALALLPRTGFSVIAPLPEPTNIRKLFLAKDPTGYPRQYFELARRSFPAFFRRCALHEATIAEVADCLRSGRGAGVAAFPFASILRSMTRCDSVTQLNALPRIGDNVLLQCRGSRQLGVSVIHAIRAAWFRLLEEPNELATQVEALFRDQRFRQALSRLSGIFPLS